jgi:hypothetical protein
MPAKTGVPDWLCLIEIGSCRPATLMLMTAWQRRARLELKQSLYAGEN